MNSSHREQHFHRLEFLEKWYGAEDNGENELEESDSFYSLHVLLRMYIKMYALFLLSLSERLVTRTYLLDFYIAIQDIL